MMIKRYLYMMEIISFILNSTLHDNFFIEWMIFVYKFLNRSNLKNNVLHIIQY